MNATRGAGVMVLMMCAAMAQAADDEKGNATSTAGSQNAMRQVEADYADAKEQCRQAKDKSRCLKEAKASYEEAKAKVKTHTTGSGDK